jgi:hypothetical protein
LGRCRQVRLKKFSWFERESKPSSRSTAVSSRNLRKDGISSSAPTDLRDGRLCGALMEGVAADSESLAGGTLNELLAAARKLCGSHENHLTEWCRVILGGCPQDWVVWCSVWEGALKVREDMPS